MGPAYLHFSTRENNALHSLVLKVGGGEKRSSLKVSLYEDQNILPAEFCQTKRDGLFLENLFLKRTRQFSSYTLISKY